MINELLQLMNDFEERNNISVCLSLCSDGSGRIDEFWEENNTLEEFKTPEELMHILSNITYKRGENGLCISPVERI